MLRNSQKTMYGIDIEEHRKFNLHYTPILNTTLNEKFGVYVNDSIPVGQWPIISAYAIGIGGNKTVDVAGEYNYSEHGPLDAALFQHIPFIIREASQDLTATERAKYRMRVIEKINNREYIAYYLKNISAPELKEGFHVIRTQKYDTNEDSTIMNNLDTTNKSYLNPKPMLKKLTYNNKYDLQYITKLSKLTFSLTIPEMEELENVFKIKDLDTNTITELAICSGVDKDVTYGKELISAQIYFHLGVTYDITQQLLINKQLIQSINLGGLEPILY